MVIPKPIKDIQALHEKFTNLNTYRQSVTFQIDNNFYFENIARLSGYSIALSAALFLEKMDANYKDLDISEYEINDYEQEIVDEGKPALIIEDTGKLIRSIYRDHKLLDVIDPRKFEEIVAELLFHKGFKVELTQQTRDNGYDIIAMQTMNGFPMKLLVECKRYKNTVGIGLIRSFCDVIDRENANKGVIVTTGYFSRDAYKRKEEKGTLLDLKDRRCLIDWIKDYNLSIR